MLTESQRREAADILVAAERDRRPVQPLRDTFPDMDAVDAYEIQLLNIRRRLAAGNRVGGHKVGLSSEPMQKMMGVDEPDYGHLLDDMFLDGNQPIPSERYCTPYVEVEVGYLLGAELPGEGCTEADVLAATEAVMPAIELIDSRIRDWRITLPDTVADNASSAGLVLGPQRHRPGDIDLTAVEVKLECNGDVVASGRSDAVLGNPTTAVAWLARKLAGFGVRLEAGHVVLPGSCTKAVDVCRGDRFQADFSGLGSISLSFG